MNAVRHVRIFKNGRSRAVRIPKDMDIFGDEVVMRVEGDRIILEKSAQKPNLAALLEEWCKESPLGPNDDFPEIDDCSAEPVTDFDK